MAPLPDNTTDRLKINYITPLGPQSVQVRPGAGVDIGTLAAVAQSLATSFATIQTNQVTWTGAEISRAGTNFFSPIATFSVTGSSPTALTEPQWPAFISFIGRATASGRRGRLFLYFPKNTLLADENYRDLVSEDPAVEAVRTALAGAGLLAIDGSPITWYIYINQGWNAYRQRQRRRS